jgi:hypothetical protein
MKRLAVALLCVAATIVAHAETDPRTVAGFDRMQHYADSQRVSIDSVSAEHASDHMSPEWQAKAQAELQALNAQAADTEARYEAHLSPSELAARKQVMAAGEARAKQQMEWAHSDSQMHETNAAGVDCKFVYCHDVVQTKHYVSYDNGETWVGTGTQYRNAN